MDVTVEIKGLKEANRALYAYSQQLGDRVVYMALRRGGALIARQAKANAPKRTGFMKRSITVKKSRIFKAKRTENILGVYVSISRKSDAWYGHLIEAGWNVRGKARTEENTPWRWSRQKITKKFSRAAIRDAGITGGRTSLPGKTNVPGQRFMQRAYLAQREAAGRLVATLIKDGAMKIAQKTGFRHG